MARFHRSHAPRSFVIAMSLAAIAIQAIAGPVLGARSTVVKVNGTDLFCPFDTPAAGGHLFAITRDRTDGGSFAFVDLVVEPTDPNAPVLVGGMDDPNLTPTGMQQGFDVADNSTGDIVGSASISATFTGTGAVRARRIYQNAVQMGIFEDLKVSGALTVSAGALTYTFDLSGCDAATQDRLDQAHHPSGPKPGGTPPGNDAPAGAKALTVGSQVQQSTGSASIQSEAPCIIGTGDDAFEFAMGRTVWFSVAGTGGSITVDPRGSDFDTVVAVYALGGGLAEPGLRR